MDDEKLKKAFGKVKKDIFTIASDVEKLRNTLKDMSRKVPNQKVSGPQVFPDKKRQDAEIAKLSEQAKINTDKISFMTRQIENLENEIKRLTPKSKSDINQLEKSILSTSREIEKFENRLSKSEDKNKSDFEDLKLIKKDYEKSRRELEDHDDKIRFLSDKVDDFTRLVEEKVLLEMESTRQEILKEMEKDRKSENGDLNDFSEMIQEKINLDISALRLEFTDEIAKIYDKFFSEVIELKDDISKEKSKKEKVFENSTLQRTSLVTKKRKEEIEAEPEVIETEDDSQKEGFVKRFTRWLFIDYEDEDEEEYGYDSKSDEMQDIKSEVKDEKKEYKKDTRERSSLKKVSTSKSSSKNKE